MLYKPGNPIIMIPLSEHVSCFMPGPIIVSQKNMETFSKLGLYFNNLARHENYQHGGSYNAYTSSETTNFYFDVNVDNFEEALDRYKFLQQYFMFR